MPVRSVNHDPGAGIAIGQGVVMIKFLMTYGKGHLIQAIAI
jgi:hypothetical protein